MRLIALILLRLLALSMAFVILIFAARGIGSRQPASAILAQLHLTDCALPCWLGIMPGRTRFDEAAQRVTAVYPSYDVTTQDTQIFITYLLGSSYGAASIQLSDGTVNSLLLVTSDVRELAIGDVAALFGKPDCIPGLSPAILIYNFPRSYVVLVANGGRAERWRQSLNSLEIHSYDQERTNFRCTASKP